MLAYRSGIVTGIVTSDQPAFYRVWVKRDRGRRPNSPAGWCPPSAPPDPAADELGRPITLDLAATMAPTCTTGLQEIQGASAGDAF
jgi:hypothetical protein